MKMENGKHHKYQIQNIKENGHKKKIPNPKYKGPWQRPNIPNPSYKEHSDVHAQDNLRFVGFDLWQVKSGTVFSNILITDSIESAAEETKEILKTIQAKEKEEEEIAAKREEELAKVRAAEQAKKEEEEKLKKEGEKKRRR